VGGRRGRKIFIKKKKKKKKRKKKPIRPQGNGDGNFVRKGGSGDQWFAGYTVVLSDRGGGQCN